MIVTVHQTPSEICWWENSNLVEHTYRPDFSLTKEKKQVQRQPTPSGLHLCGEGFVQHEHNIPKHTSK